MRTNCSPVKNSSAPKVRASLIPLAPFLVPLDDVPAPSKVQLERNWLNPQAWTVPHCSTLSPSWLVLGAGWGWNSPAARGDSYVPALLSLLPHSVLLIRPTFWDRCSSQLWSLSVACFPELAAHRCLGSCLAHSKLSTVSCEAHCSQPQARIRFLPTYHPMATTCRSTRDVCRSAPLGIFDCHSAVLAFWTFRWAARGYCPTSGVAFPSSHGWWHAEIANACVIHVGPTRCSSSDRPCLYNYTLIVMPSTASIAASTVKFATTATSQNPFDSLFRIVWMSSTTPPLKLKTNSGLWAHSHVHRVNLPRLFLPRWGFKCPWNLRINI